MVAGDVVDDRVERGRASPKARCAKRLKTVAHRVGRKARSRMSPARTSVGGLSWPGEIAQPLDQAIEQGARCSGRRRTDAAGGTGPRWARSGRCSPPRNADRRGRRSGCRPWRSVPAGNGSKTCHNSPRKSRPKASKARSSPSRSGPCTRKVVSCQAKSRGRNVQDAADPTIPSVVADSAVGHRAHGRPRHGCRALRSRARPSVMGPGRTSL